MRTSVIVCLLLSCAAVARSAFTFEFEIVRHHTNGNCFGMDFTIPCETFVTDFCLRGASYIETTNTDLAQCPLGINSHRVFEDAPQTRTIESSLPWPGSFQLFIGAHDDDYPATSFDFLDHIFIDESRSVSNQFSGEETFWGVHNKVGVDIRFRVMCQSNYYSSDCSVYCLARDDSSGHYTCNPVDGSIVCNSGYEHPETNCVDRITACSSSPCLQQGTCTPIGTTDFTCSCPPGYTGKRCETDINECEPDPCLNGGNCSNLIADYSCACVPGYTGKDCDIDIDECLLAECVENAHCIDGINSYECVCNHGFEGPNCTEIEPCDNSPCAVTGQCQSMGPFNYTCSCDPGYTGPTCAVNVDDCLAAVCPENSDCVDGVTEYTCVCHHGFTGDNCTEIPVAEGVPGASSSAAAIGGAVGALSAFIILLWIIILIVILVIVFAKRGRSKRELSVPENMYDVEPTGTMTTQSGDPLIDNPLYLTSSSPEPIPNSHNPNSYSHGRTSPDIEMSESPAYASTLREVNNPLYGSSSPTHTSNGPVYSEPVKADLTVPEKGAENYPYSYAVVDRDRRPTTKKGLKETLPPPNYEQVTMADNPAGPKYEDVQFKPVPNGDTPTPNGYQVPKPVATTQSGTPQPLVYHYAASESTVTQKPPKLGEAKATTKESAPKKSIYDSQNDGTEEAPRKPSKPVPPPRTKPAVAKKPEVYSYATSDTARASIKVKDVSDGGNPPPYNRLEHDLGPDVSAHQIRLANIQGSGYEALQSQ